MKKKCGRSMNIIYIYKKVNDTFFFQFGIFLDKNGEQKYCNKISTFKYCLLGCDLYIILGIFK